MQPTWRKSTFSGSETSCVEITHTPETVRIRDSKNPAGGQLTISPAALENLNRAAR